MAAGGLLALALGAAACRLAPEEAPSPRAERPEPTRPAEAERGAAPGEAAHLAPGRAADDGWLLDTWIAIEKDGESLLIGDEIGLVRLYGFEEGGRSGMASSALGYVAEDHAGSWRLIAWSPGERLLELLWDEPTDAPPSMILVRRMACGRIEVDDGHRWLMEPVSRWVDGAGREE